MEQIKKWLKENLLFTILLLIIIIIRIFFYSPIRVNGSSMYPTLQDKEFMILNKIGLQKGINHSWKECTGHEADGPDHNL